MPATINIQGAIPYAGNYQSFQSRLLLPPPEGNLTIPVSVEWVNDTVSPNFSMQFQLQGQRNLQISQISALYVDNLSNAADVAFYFPDTQFRLDIPSYSEGVFPVVTNGLQFTAQCLSAADGDSTFIQILNFNPPPVALVKVVFQSPGTEVNIALPSTVTPTHMNIISGAGVLRGFSISVAGAASSIADTVSITLTDDTGGGTGARLFGALFSTSTTAGNLQFASPPGFVVEFSNGVTLNLNDIGGDVTAGAVSANIYTS